MKKGLSHALLDEEKLTKIRNQLIRTVARVPKATEWTAQTEECGLTRRNLHEILLVAFGWTEPHQTEQPTAGGKMPYILRIAAVLLGRADSLEAKQTTYGRVIAVTRMVGYALMRVCEVVDELTPSQVSIICISQQYYADA
jgi:hypothetical protein